MVGQDTSFNPAVHGWPFSNHGWDEAQVYELLGFIPVWSAALCGGMALAALDFFMNGIAIPRDLPRPSRGQPLYDHIVQRQRDSLGAMVPGFVRYVFHDPFESHHARWQHLVREDQHLGIIQKYVARNEPIILGLLNRYVGVPTSSENSHHQVLAIGWEKLGPRWVDVRIKIYDPNYPDRTVVLVPIEGSGPPLDRFNRSDYDRYVPTLDGTLNTIIREGNYNFWGAGFPHDGLPAEVPYVQGQSEWRYCGQCHSMFFDGYPDKGVCPAGGGHAAIGLVFVLAHDIPETPLAQTNWRYCDRCHALFFDGYPDKGVCPAGGGHAAAGWTFVLPHDVAEWPGAQGNWRFCGKCEALFFDGYPDKGVCPAGGGHSAVGLNLTVPHI